MRERINDYVWGYDACSTEAPRSSLRLFLQIMAMTGRDLMGGMITLWAMSLVYTTLLSIVPLLAVSISVLKGFGVHDQLEPLLASILAPLGEQSLEVSARIVGFVDNMKIGVLGALGLALLMYTVISLIQKIEAAFNHTWRLQGNRSLLQRFSDYLSVIMVGPVLLFSAVGITASLGNNRIVEFMSALPYMNDLLLVIGKLLPFVLVIAAFTFIYLLIPNTRVKPRSALYGAAIAGAMWELSGIVFTSFVGGSTQYTAIYSGFAILLVFMIWLYLSWVILLLGASISFYHQHPEYLKWNNTSAHLSGRMRNQLALRAMVDIARAHDRQIDLITSLDSLAGNQRVPADVLARILDALEDDGLVRQSADSPPRYLPGASLPRILLADILRSAQRADDEKNTDIVCGDERITALLGGLEQSAVSHLGEQSLADYIAGYEDEARHETSLV